jgi:hypothetical protein
MTDYSDILDKLREFNYMRKDLAVCHDAADAIEAQAKRIADLQHLIGNLNDELAQLRKLFEMCAQLAEAHKGCEISRSEGMPCEAGKELAVAIRKLGDI